MMTVDTKAPTAAPTETRALVPTWLAYAAAGFTFVAAAYLWTSIPAFLTLYEDLGVMLPALVVLQISYPTLLPLVMIGLGGLALVATRQRVPVGPRGRVSNFFVGLASVGLILFSILMVLMNAVTVRSLQQMVGEQDTLDDHYLDQKLAWAKKLPRVAAASAPGRVSLAGKGQPLAEALASLAKQANVRIRLAPSAAKLEVWTTLKDAGWRTALTALTRGTDLQMYWISEVDLILVPANRRATVCPETHDFSGARLGDVVKALRVVAAPVTCDPAVADRRVTVQFVEAPQAELLTVLAVLTNTAIQTDSKTGACRFVPRPK